jgi:hypothetical protein
VDDLIVWGARWAFGEPDPAELDPVLLLWWMHGRVRRERLPPRRVVVQFDFSGARVASMWLLLDPADVSVCLQHPGFDVDLLVTADLAAFYRVWLGRCTLAEALRREQVRLDGPPALARAFPRWWALSPTAEVVRATAGTPRPRRDATAGISARETRQDPGHRSKGI